MINKSIKYSPKLKALGFLGKWSFTQVCGSISFPGWVFPPSLESSFVCRECCCMAGSETRPVPNHNKEKQWNKQNLEVTSLGWDSQRHWVKENKIMLRFMKCVRAGMGSEPEITPWEGGEAQGDQRSCGYPWIPGMYVALGDMGTWSVVAWAVLGWCDSMVSEAFPALGICDSLALWPKGVAGSGCSGVPGRCHHSVTHPAHCHSAFDSVSDNREG